MHVETSSAQQTLALGRLLGRLAPPMPAVTCIALDGPLGAGKTHLTHGIAEGAQVADDSLVSSPTYVLMNIYEPAPSGKRVYHLDAYRIQSADAFDELGFDEIVSGATGGGIVVVEWARRVPEALPSDTLWIALAHAGKSHRTLDLDPAGPLSQALLGRFLAVWPPPS